MRAGKEYGKADSRYASRDSFTICMEAVTSFVEGPLCFVILYGIVRQRAWRFPLSIIVAVGEIYGTILYFGISRLEGMISFTRLAAWHIHALHPHVRVARGTFVGTRVGGRVPKEQETALR